MINKLKSEITILCDFPFIDITQFYGNIPTLLDLFRNSTHKTPQ